MEKLEKMFERTGESVKFDGSDFEAVFKWGSDPLVNRFMLYPLYKNA